MNSEFGSQNTELRTWNSKFRIQNTEHGVLNVNWMNEINLELRSRSEFGSRNLESATWNLEFRIQILELRNTTKHGTLNLYFGIWNLELRIRNLFPNSKSIVSPPCPMKAPAWLWLTDPHQLTQKHRLPDNELYNPSDFYTLRLLVLWISHFTRIMKWCASSLAYLWDISNS